MFTALGYVAVCAVLVLPFTPLLFPKSRDRWLSAFTRSGR